MVVSAIHTIGNYEYGFFWYFYLDGTIQFEAKLTGIVQTRAIAPGEKPRYGTLVAPQLDAPNHQHLFCMRLDMEVDGPQNSVVEVDAVGLPVGPDNPYGNAIVARETVLENERDGRRSCDPRTARTWKIVNPNVRNRLGSSRRLQAGALHRPDAARRPGQRPRPPGRVRPREPVGDPLQPRRTAPRRRLPEPASRRRNRHLDPAGARPRQHRRRALAHLRHLAPAAAGRLAGHAVRLRRIHPQADRILRPQPGARRSAAPGPRLRAL